jgi:hypothetical protein
LLTGVCQQQRQDRPTASRQAQRQQVQHRPAVGHRPVIVEEETEPAEQIVELGAAQAVLRPGHLTLGAGPGLVDEQGEASLQEAPVEAGIVGDDEIGGRCQRADDLVVELLAAQLIVGNAGEPDHLVGQRLAGILEAGIAGQDVIEHASEEK